MTSRFSTLVWLALRNLGRELRRSSFTAAAMAVGLALLIVSRTLSDGAHEDWIDAGVRLGTGHIVFNAPGYRDSESLEDRLSAEEVAATLAAARDAELHGPSLSTVRVSTRGLASSPEGGLPAWIQGVDPADELAFSRLGSDVHDGRYLEEGDRLHAFIGTGMATRLGLRIGSRMVLTAQVADGGIEGQLVRVVGLFRTGLSGLDDALVHIPLATARDWLGVEGATSVATLLPHSVFTGQVIAEASAALDASRVEVTGWEESTPDLYSMVKMDDAGDWVFHFILFAIVALAILNAVFMSVLHRKRELGLLRALGLSARETGLVVFMEGVMLTTAAGVAGVVFGFCLVWVFFRDGIDLTGMMPADLTFGGIVFNPVLQPVIELKHLTQSLFFTAVIGLSASIYPAWQVAALDPAESVKVE